MSWTNSLTAIECQPKPKLLGLGNQRYPVGTLAARSARSRATGKRLQQTFFPRADGETRTPDPFITSEVLYQLSYVGILLRGARLSVAAHVPASCLSGR